MLDKLNNSSQTVAVRQKFQSNLVLCNMAKHLHSGIISLFQKSCSFLRYSIAKLSHANTFNMQSYLLW